ncbi:MAG: C40 family peptidase [FCB group bacterium]|nr:C40 family peptidase [FCB group bacterium]
MQQSVQSFVGVPYVWGGETRSGTDCSGFTKTVYYEQGIIIPRVSYQQYKVGSAVKKDNLDYGDLVFFNKRGWGKINHVGLFVGDGKFAQASCSRGVTISKLSKRYYRTRYVGAKRIIQ